MNSGSPGSFNKLMYDKCAHDEANDRRVGPYMYMMYQGKHENCNKCRKDKFWVPYHPNMVDVESELSNRTRPASNCSQFKYRPGCETSKMCMSTYSASAPVILPPEVCPIVTNNIPRTTSNGIPKMGCVPSTDPCFCPK